MNISYIKHKSAYKIFAAIILAVLITVTIFFIFGRPAFERPGNSFVHAPAGWIKHSVKYGPSVIAPDNWRFKLDSGNGSVSLNGVNKERAVIWPLFSAKNINMRAAELTLIKLGRKVWPGYEWKYPSAPSLNLISMKGYKGKDKGIALLTWVNTPKGTAICIFMASAPAKNFKAKAPVFARIFQSFHVSGRPLAKIKRRPAIRYLTWQDPRERAFTLQVPRSWNVAGGAYRYAPLDVRIEARSVSPDNKIIVQLGDADIPTYTFPNRLLSMGGFNEGSYYSPGYGLRYIVLHYMPGLEYARYYAENYVSGICRGIRITYSKNRRDISGSINQSYMAYNLPIRLSAGETKFSCLRNGIASKGYIFAGTYRTSTIWGIMYLFIALAPPHKFNEAMAVLSHEIGTFKENPRWAAMNEHIASNASKINAEANKKIEHMISSSYNYRSRVMDEIARRRENAILGENDVVDTETGVDYKVDSGSNYYWISHDGTIVGTVTDSVPNHDVNFKKLLLRP